MSGRLIKLLSIITALVFMLILPGATLAAGTSSAAAETTGGIDLSETATNTVTGSAAGATGTPLEGLNISFWPEYDEPAVLVMYQGKLDASIKTPAQIKIAIPKGDDVRLTATSVVDPSNQFQYDRAWETHEVVHGQDMDILTYEAIYPTFQFEIYMKPVSGKGKRNFDFTLPVISNIKVLDVNIRKPVRAENFQVTPVAAETKQEEQFEDYLYSFSNVTPGQNFSFNVSYDRADSNPSINKETGEVDTSGGSRSTAVIAIGIVVLIGGALGLGIWRMSATATPIARPVAKPGNTKGNKSKGSAEKKGNGKKNKFCPQCGEKIDPGAKFCPDCGKDL
jgi:hypothetical protein